MRTGSFARAMPVFNLTLPRAVKALLEAYPADTLKPGDAVTVLSELPGISGRATYDVETGVLLAIARTEAASGITTELHLDALP